MKYEFIIIGSIVVVAVTAFYIYTKNKKKKSLLNAITVEIIDKELKFFDVIAWFKNLKLDKKKHKPFIANYEDFKESFPNSKKTEQEIPDGYVSIFLGVYNENDDVIEGKIIYSKSLDKELLNTLGKEKLVLLT